jgi:flagellar export protein FliJ
VADKDLRTLIRLHRWRLDEKRLKLAGALRLLADLERRGIELERQMADERAVAGADPAEAGRFFGAYAAVAMGRRDEIAAALVDTEDRVAAARDELADARRELKKFEAAQEARDLAEAEERARRDQAVLDEVALQIHLRRRA